MTEWQELAELLVEVDLTIEDLDSWATEPEDLAALEHLERLRDELQTAIARGRISRSLRQQLDEGRQRHGITSTVGDPRD